MSTTGCQCTGRCTRARACTGSAGALPAGTLPPGGGGRRLTPLAGAPRPARRRGAPGKISSSSTMRGASFPSPGSATTSDVAGSARCWSTHASALASHYGKLGCAAQHLESVDPRLDAARRLVGQENAEERPHRLILLVEPFTRLAKHGDPLLLPMRDRGGYCGGSIASGRRHPPAASHPREAIVLSHQPWRSSAVADRCEQSSYSLLCFDPSRHSVPVTNGRSTLNTTARQANGTHTSHDMRSGCDSAVSRASAKSKCSAAVQGICECRINEGGSGG